MRACSTRPRPAYIATSAARYWPEAASGEEENNPNTPSAPLPLTTVASLHEDELKQVLGLPADVNTYALIPIGYPLGKFGAVKRLPVEEVTCLDKWGTPFTQS